MSLGNAGIYPVDAPGEFRCDICNYRCTRDPIDGTEYGHRVQCPNRPEKLQHLTASAGNEVHDRDSDRDRRRDRAAEEAECA